MTDIIKQSEDRLERGRIDQALYTARGSKPLEDKDAELIQGLLDVIRGRGWKSMDSAPKDEEQIYIFCKESGTAAVGYWDAYYAKGGRGYTDGYAWIEPTSGEPLELHYGLATHWKPLPPPPTVK